MIDLRQKITDQQIEAYRYCKRKKEGNYANIYASSLKLPLYKEELRDVSLHWRGSSNQRVIDVQKSLKKGEIVLWNS